MSVAFIISKTKNTKNAQNQTARLVLRLFQIGHTITRYFCNYFLQQKPLLKAPGLFVHQ